MNVLQPIDELEKWWEAPDPWLYEKNPDDLNRRALLLSLLPKRQYDRILDIGCGNGFVTERLPGKEVIGIDVSANAVEHARQRGKEHSHITYLQHSLFDLPHLCWSSLFDLIVITGVLYPQYIAQSERLAYIIINNLLLPAGHLVSCHIDEWYKSRFPYVTVSREYYPYREYDHILEVYLK
jgi:2-polyprenyl-3-methyl-5-hydroxy-6-metoxy-1,4-benzoquinol methylase